LFKLFSPLFYGEITKVTEKFSDFGAIIADALHEEGPIEVFMLFNLINPINDRIGAGSNRDSDICYCGPFAIELHRLLESFGAGVHFIKERVLIRDNGRFSTALTTDPLYGFSSSETKLPVANTSS